MYVMHESKAAIASRILKDIEIEDKEELLLNLIRTDDTRAMQTGILKHVQTEDIKDLISEIIDNLGPLLLLYILLEYINPRSAHLPKANYDIAVRYCDILHGDSKGYVTVGHTTYEYNLKDSCDDKEHPVYRHRTDKFKDIKWSHILYELPSYYISPNTFTTRHYRAGYLQELKALYVDLNVYNTEYSKEQVLHLLETKYIGRIIPIPTFIIDTGRGLRVEILLTDTPASELERWREVQHYLFTVLKPFGSHAKSTSYATLNRVPGTMNPKYGTMVKIVRENLDKYNLEDIFNMYVAKINPIYNKLYKSIYTEVESATLNDECKPATVNTIEYKLAPNPEKARRRITTLPKSEYTNALSYIKLLYGEEYSGYACIWAKDGRWNGETYVDKNTNTVKDVKFHFYKHNQLPKQGYKESNLFITMNSFKSRKRSIENLLRINALFVDLDVYNGPYSKKETISILKDRHFDKTIPTPSLIMDSGGGLYLIWLLTPMPNAVLPVEKAKEYFTELENYLIGILNELAPDPGVKDTSRLLRLPGSYNSKYKHLPQVKILAHTGYQYNLKELAHEYVPYCVQTKISDTLKTLIGYHSLEEIGKKNPHLKEHLLEQTITTIPISERDTEPKDPVEYDKWLERRLANIFGGGEPDEIEEPRQPIEEVAIEEQKPKLTEFTRNTASRSLTTMEEILELIAELKGTQNPIHKPKEDIIVSSNTDWMSEACNLDWLNKELAPKPIDNPSPKSKRETRHSITSLGIPILNLMPHEMVEKTNTNGTKYKQKIYHIKGESKIRLKNDRGTQLRCGQRVHDIELLCRLRNYQLEGIRHSIITYHLYHLCYYFGDSKEALERTKLIYNKIKANNNKEGDPYSEEEFIRDTQTVIKDYEDNSIEAKIYSNSHIVKQLKITDEECKESNKLDNLSDEEIKNLNKAELNVNSKDYVPHMLQLLTPYEKNVLRPRRAVSRNYKREREKEGYIVVSREDIKKCMSARASKVLELTKQGYGTADIARLMGISTSTIKRDKRDLKGQGLLE